MIFFSPLAAFALLAQYVHTHVTSGIMFARKLALLFLVVSLLMAIGAAYLAYFGISSEQQLNDPSNTGGILAHDWLLGYWITWLGLLVPMFVAIFRPHEDGH